MQELFIMATNKTQETENSVTEFINIIEPEQKRADSFALVHIFQEVSGHPPKMWGGSIIGFGSYHYKYDSGREGDFLIIGFSPRKNSISLYFSCDVNNQHRDLLSDFGKYKTGKSCVYINKLSDINVDVLKELAKKSMEFTLQKYPNN
jgi:DNA-dependent RNA polymerase auxiliary subunit epsilon